MALAPHDQVKVALPLVGGIATFTGFIMNSTGRTQAGSIFFAVGALLTAVSGATILYSVLSRQQELDQRSIQVHSLI